MVVLHTLTPQWGRRSFVYNLKKARGTALIQPLSILDGEISENPRSELWRVSSLRAGYPLNGIRSDVRKNAITMFLGEVLFRSLREENSVEDGLFEWCRGAILTLDALPGSFGNFHLLFLLDLATAMGFMPDVAGLAPFAGDKMDSIARLLTLEREQALMLPLSGGQRSDIAEKLLEYLGHHCEIKLNVRSLKVLRELFN